MQKFCFKLNKTEEQFRQNIETAMMYSRPEAFLFSTNYGKGLSFTQNGDVIKGVYLQCSDKEKDGLTRGSSVRVRFHGKIISNDEGSFFIGWIYPDLIATIIILVAFFTFLFGSEAVGQMIIPTVATVIFFVADVFLTKKCFDELLFLTSGE